MTAFVCAPSTLSANSQFLRPMTTLLMSRSPTLLSIAIHLQVASEWVCFIHTEKAPRMHRGTSHLITGAASHAVGHISLVVCQASVVASDMASRAFVFVPHLHGLGVKRAAGDVAEISAVLAGKKSIRIATCRQNPLRSSARMQGEKSRKPRWHRMKSDIHVNP